MPTPEQEALAQLRAEVAELRQQLDPQAMRQRLERTWDPRGGEPRIQDSDGATLDYAPTLAFENCAVQVDAPNRRIIITPQGGGLVFNADGTPDEGVDSAWFRDADDPTKVPGVFQTLTSAWGLSEIRSMGLFLAEDLLGSVGTTDSTVASLTLISEKNLADTDTNRGQLIGSVAAPGLSASAALELVVHPEEFMYGVQCLSTQDSYRHTAETQDADLNAVCHLTASGEHEEVGRNVVYNHTQIADEGYSGYTVTSTGSSDAGGGAIELRATDHATAGAHLHLHGDSSADINCNIHASIDGVDTLTILDGANRSDIMRVLGGDGSSSPIGRRMYGPLRGTITVPAGGTASLFFPYARAYNTETHAMLGGIQEATPTGWVTWAYSDSGGGTATVLLRNHDSGASHEVTFTGYLARNLT